MLPERRRLRIMETLNAGENGTVSVTELSQLLEVSKMTIRRDLDWLEEMGLLKRVHGGAVRHRGMLDEKSFNERNGQFNGEKDIIARAAAQLVRDGERIILDAGTTTRQLARNLTSKRNLSVVTNALPVAREMCRCRDVSCIVLGGMLKQKELCTVGPTVTEQLSHLSVDKLFLSASGFTAKSITDPGLWEVAVKQAMIRASPEVILVADSSKWGKVDLVQIAPLRSIHKIVTDDGIPLEAVESIEGEGVEMITPLSLASKAVLR